MTKIRYDTEGRNYKEHFWSFLFILNSINQMSMSIYFSAPFSFFADLFQLQNQFVVSLLYWFTIILQYLSLTRSEEICRSLQRSYFLSCRKNVDIRYDLQTTQDSLFVSKEYYKVWCSRTKTSSNKFMLQYILWIMVFFKDYGSLWWTECELFLREGCPAWIK